MKEIIEFVKSLIKPRVKIKTKVVERLLPYRLLPQIESGVAAKYVLNELIKILEEQREYYFTNQPNIMDLNDKNVGKIIGRSEVTFSTLNLIKQYLQDFIEKTRRG